MADPQKPRQPIEDTSGFIVLQDGRKVPTLDTWMNQQGAGVPGFGVAEQRTRAGQMYQTGAQTLSNTLGDIVASPVIAAETLGLVSPDTAKMYRDADRNIASALVPQTLTQAGIEGGMMLGGGLGMAAKAGRLMSGASTVFGGTAGGAAGGLAEYGTTVGAGVGAGQGMLESAASVGASELFDLARKIGPSRIRQKMNIEAAQATGEALEQMPSLKGVFSGVRDERGLRDLALGTIEQTLPDGTKITKQKGLELLTQKMDQYNSAVQTILDQSQTPKLFPVPVRRNPKTFALEKTIGASGT